MSTFKELAYMVQDELKLLSDDATYTLDHIVFLLNKYRAHLLHEKYAKGKFLLEKGNKQVIKVSDKSIIPTLLNIHLPNVYTNDGKDVAFTNYERFRNVGYNKYLTQAAYASIDYNNQFVTKNINGEVYLEAIFQDAIKAALYNDTDKDILTIEMPLEETLIPQLIQFVVKELMGATYRPSDDINNANDDLADMMSFIRRNMKSNMQKQIED